MAWRRSMMVSLPTYICVTRPQWVKDNIFQLLIWSSNNLYQMPNWSGQIIRIPEVEAFYLDVLNRKQVWQKYYQPNHRQLGTYQWRNLWKCKDEHMSITQNWSHDSWSTSSYRLVAINLHRILMRCETRDTTRLMFSAVTPSIQIMESH